MAAYFSIILPIYNVAAYLDRCIRSVLDQNFRDYELILVDDGSTDRSPEICDFYAREYPHIRVIHKLNGGLSSARNAGLEQAQGEYIWWVDSDDWIEENALEILQCAIEKTTPDMVKFNYIRVEHDTAITAQTNVAPGLYETKEAIGRLMDLAFLRAGKFGLSAWSYVYSRAFLEKHGLRFVSERQIGSEDYLFNLQALPAAERIEVLPDALYSYELRMGSLTQRYKKELPQRYTKLFLGLMEHYRAIGMFSAYGGKINSFFVWHLLHGTCMSNEYEASQDHTLVQGRKNVRSFLRAKQTRYALRHCETRCFSGRQKMQIWAMRLGLEPVFYHLYVRKPGKKKGKRNET